MTPSPVFRREKLISPDALRGFTIALMIVVNFPGSETFVFFPLRHSEWNGLSVTDQVAPFFLFIIGVSVVMAFAARVTPGAGQPQSMPIRGRPVCSTRCRLSA